MAYISSFGRWFERYRFAWRQPGRKQFFLPYNKETISFYLYLTLLNYGSVNRLFAKNRTGILPNPMQGL